MRTRRMALVSCLAAGCGAGSITASEDGGSSTSTGDETSTGEPSVDLPHEPTCGDGIVDASEDCEPGGPVPCNDDCTLPADGTGALEWTFVGDVGGHAHGVAVGTGGRATVCGTLYPVPPGDPEFIAQGWIARFEPDGVPSWQLVDAGPDEVGIRLDDVELDVDGRAIVGGYVGFPGSSAWGTRCGPPTIPLRIRRSMASQRCATSRSMQTEASMYPAPKCSRSTVTSTTCASSTRAAALHGCSCCRPRAHRRSPSSAASCMQHRRISPRAAPASKA